MHYLADGDYSCLLFFSIEASDHGSTLAASCLVQHPALRRAWFAERVYDFPVFGPNQDRDQIHDCKLALDPGIDPPMAAVRSAAVDLTKRIAHSNCSRFILPAGAAMLTAPAMMPPSLKIGAVTETRSELISP